MSALRVTVTGATGLVGPALVAALQQRGAHVTVLSRDPGGASARLGTVARDGGGAAEPVEAARWELMSEPAPLEALQGRDAVVHLAGESVAQRWTSKAKRAIRESRVTGTRNLVEGLRGTDARPPVLVSASAVGYYGPHGEEPLDEDAPAGHAFLPEVCTDWEREAGRASELGMRVVQVRIGVVLDSRGGALRSMLPPFRLGLGGPIAGGRQYISWIHLDDLVGIILTAIADGRWSGPVNATAPEPVCNRDFSSALGRVLGRPARLPLPGAALRVLYGEMAEVITTGARVVPAKALVLGYEFRHPRVQEALRAAISPG